MNRISPRLLAGAVAALFACSGTAAFAQSAPNDAQIAGIVVAANTVDIDAGKLAEKTAHHPEVKAFARQMVTDHTGVNQQAGALVKKLKVTPQDSEIAAGLKRDGAENIARLKGMKGKHFDKAYVEHEVAYHQAVIDALDKTLVPNARNAELKETLLKVRPAFVAHLEHAKQLRASMK